MYKFISDFYEKSNEKLHMALALEKAIEYQPNNGDYLFSAAYNYSESELEQMSLVHYSKKIQFEPDGSDSALNNLGVTLKSLDLKYKSVEYYRQAEQQGSTLSASNLFQRVHYTQLN